MKAKTKTSEAASASDAAKSLGILFYYATASDDTRIKLKALFFAYSFSIPSRDTLLSVSPITDDRAKG